MSNVDKNIASAVSILSVMILLLLPYPTRAGILPACAATGACQVCDIVTVFVTLGKWLMVSAGGLALLVITWAAFGFVSSAGNPEKITGAKKQITGAIFGVGITLVAFQLVSIVIATLAIPSTNQGFAGQTSEDTGKFASLADFLGIPWWNICNVKELRKLGASKQTDITYKGTGVCRYWGDGTPCEEVSEEREKKLIECGYLEGNSDLTPEEKEKQKEECKAAQEETLRCCKGACSDKECITEKIAQPIAQSSQAYQGPANILATPGPLGAAAAWKDLIHTVTKEKKLLNDCILTAIVDQESLNGKADSIGYDTNRVSGEKLNMDSGDSFLGLVGLKSDSSRSVCNTGCSRGIGLTQITIYPYDKSVEKGGGKWSSSSIPTRQINARFYTIRDLLDPEKDLKAAADLFNSNQDMLTRVSPLSLSTWGNIFRSQEAAIPYSFAAYNGGVGAAKSILNNPNSSSWPGVRAYMNKIMGYYNTCMSNGG